MITEINDIAISGKPQLFISTKKHSLHHIIDKLLTLTGPADVHIITYSVSDTALRFLCSLKTKGNIKNLNFVFDHSVKKHKFPLCVFASKFADHVVFTSTHIKMVCIENEKHKLSIITSANLTDNMRAELYEIVSDKEMIESCFKLYTALISHTEFFKYVC